MLNRATLNSRRSLWQRGWLKQLAPHSVVDKEVNMARIVVEIPEKIHRELKSKLAMKGKTIKKFVVEHVLEFLAADQAAQNQADIHKGG